MSPTVRDTAGTEPDVTVIVAAFDAMPYVTRCIQSVFDQTIGMDRIELIVVDDGSADGTGAELDRLAALAPTMQVVHQANSGSPAHPRNVALSMATGRYVFFLDADDYLGTEALQRMVTVGDANRSDVVFGRLVGVGGRKTPRVTFRVNQPRADLFSSRVFWSLNPMKLFRREQLTALGLKFATDLPWGEDMPFVAESFLNASVISIVGDYDCVYLTYRDDGNNFTKRVSSAASRLGCPSRLLSMVERYVHPGRQRDYLMSRVFGLEVINILPRLAAETDAAARTAGFDTIRGWLERWYTRPIAWRLSPLHRIALNLVRRGKYDEVVALFPEWPPTTNWGVTVEGERVFADYPYFRERAVGVPDDCYEITRRLKAHCHVDRLTRSERSVTLAGYAFIDVLDTDGMQVTLVVGRRGGGAEYDIPATGTLRDGLAVEEWNRVLTRTTSGFEVTLDVTTAANGAPLPTGWWDLSVRVEAEGVTRQVGIGTISCKATAAGPVLAEAAVRQVDADMVAPGDECPIVADSASWSRTARSAIEISGRCDVADSDDSSLSLVLLRREGGLHRIPLEVEDGRFATLVPLASLDGGRPIENGTWDFALESRVGDTGTIVPIPVDRKLRARLRRSGLRPVRMLLGGPSPTLTLTCERVGAKKLIGRLKKQFRFVRTVFGQRT